MVKLTAFITAHPFIALFLSGLWGAIAVDLTAFYQSADPENWLGSFNVKKHLLRWLQASIGNVIGTAVVAGGAAVVGLILFW